jgi:DNA-binding MarR family transcriptional regulator
MKDPLTRLPGYVLRRASAATVSELNRRLQPLDLRHAEAACLLLIDFSPRLTQSEIGRILDIQRSNMVPFVLRLESRSLVEREQVDGRSQGLILTRIGRSVLPKVRKVVEAYEAALIRRVPEELRPMVLPILTALWNRDERDGLEL